MCHPSATWSQLTWNREAAVCLKLAVFRNRVNKVSQIGKLFGVFFFFFQEGGDEGLDMESVGRSILQRFGAQQRWFTALRGLSAEL